MFYTNGIEVPKLTFFEGYALRGSVAGFDIFLFIVFLAIFLAAYAFYGIEKIDDIINSDLPTRKRVAKITTVSLVGVVLGVLVAGLVVILPGHETGADARKTMLLNHYNAKVQVSQKFRIPNAPDDYTVIENVLVTRDDGTTIPYNEVYVIMSVDGLVSLNINEGTEGALALVPLDQVE